ncbi:hypothetical protein [Gelidibacter sp.]|uniref:hypothetical protein n=1 Tax=Gelidibacter sp. TaxID=2018083 RepID=UPI002BEAE633|nr:hypothetical protein [Gelidibacter sp.]HUH28567.1 hypothetical protein [Gelidibacter sp.]
MVGTKTRIATPNLPPSLEILNHRNRALAIPATQAYTSASFTTPAAMVAALIKERRIE